MLRSICIFSIAAAFIVSSATISSFASEMPETARVPAAAMTLLDDMRGDWKTTVKIRTDAGEWRIQSVNLVRISSHLNGLLLTEEEIERIEGDQSSPQLKIDLTFDQYRDVYRVSAIDSGWGIMDIYEGTLENGELVLTNLRADTSFPLDDGGALHFQLRIPVAGDEKVMLVNMSSDGGASWRPFFQITYSRRP